MTGRIGLSLNGYEVTVEHIEGVRKKPCLMVKTPEENAYYKVASFNSEETADWFLTQIKKCSEEKNERFKSTRKTSCLSCRTGAAD